MDLSSKLNKIKAFLSDNQAVLITSRYNLAYFSGVDTIDGAIIVTKDKSYGVYDSRYNTMMKELAKPLEIVLSSKNAIKNIVLENYINQLYIENLNMTISQKDYYTNLLSGTELIYVDNKLNKIRRIKTEEEIGYIKKSQEITDKVFLHILKFLKNNNNNSNLTEKRLRCEIDKAILTFGGEKSSFDTICASGVNSSVPHAVPTDKIIKKGEFITMDFGSVYKGYASDMTRTVAFGYITQKMANVYDVVLNAQKEALDNIHAGLTGAQCDAFARDYISEKGYGDYFCHSLGHSLGLEIHESPNFSPRSEDIIKENMILSVEPGIYIPGEFGVRIEDIVICRKNGIEDMTKSIKKLIIL